MRRNLTSARIENYASRSQFHKLLLRWYHARSPSAQKNAPVAQLDRASDFGSEGWGFESLRARHLSLAPRFASSISMNPRHAAALALVGWYLMIPPRTAHDQQTFDDRAPLARWFVFSVHDAAHECEGAKFLNREGHKQSGDPMKAALDSAQCIATDDPRLKEK